MFIEIILVLIISSIQSIFGVGVLLVGTPFFLLIGYNFTDALELLLPISILINLTQIINEYNYIQKNLVFKICIISLPCTALFLTLAIYLPINLPLLIGILLIVFSIKSKINFIEVLIKKIMKKSFLPYFLIGFVHGMSNLGGSLLTVLVHTNISNKFNKRSTIASSYIFLAITQIIVLFLINKNISINYFLVILGFITFLFVNKYIYFRINNSSFNYAFDLLIFITGIFLVCNKWLFGY